MVIKSALQGFYDEVDDVLEYSYLVINTGNATLSSPFSVADDKIGTVTCPDTATLDPGGSITCTGSYTVNQGDLDAGSVTNTATAQGYHEGNPVNSGPDDATVPARDAANPSLIIVKRAEENTYREAGDVIHYSYLLVNNGNVTLDGPFSVDDDKASDESCPGDDSLEPGQSLTCTATYEITEGDVDAGSVTNAASARGYYNDQPVDSGQDTENVTKCNCDYPALVIVKTASESTFAVAGDVLNYTYLLINAGNVTLEGPFSVDDDKASDESCPGISSLGAGDSLQCSASYTVTDEDVSAGSVTNLATGQGTFNGNPVTTQPDSETVDVIGSQRPSILVVKSASESGYDSEGDVLHYSYIIVNNGNVPLNGPFSIDDDKASDENCPNVDTLLPGNTLTCTATYTVTEADLQAGSVTNVATASGTFNGGPIYSGPDNETVNANISPAPALMIVKSADPSLYTEAGDVINYSYLLINSGNVPLQGPFSVNDDRTDNESCPDEDTLDPGETMTCSSSYTITPADMNSGSVSNTASGQGYSNGNPINSSPDSETVNLAFTPAPSMTIIKSARETSYNAAGDVLHYTYYIVNTGNVPLDGPFSVSDDKASDESCPDEDSLDPGDFITCTATYTVEAGDLSDGSVTNKATAGASYNGEPVNSGETSATVPVGSAPIPSLRIVKSATETSYNAEGDVLNYTYFVINTGTVTLYGPFTVYDDLASDESCPTTDSLDPGGLIICTASYTVTADDMAAGSVTNAAFAEGYFNDSPVKSLTDNETVNADVNANPGLLIVKSAQEDNFTTVGDILHYSYLVINTGNVTLDGPFSVDDDKASDETCPDTASLDPGGSITCTATYTVTQADLDAGSVTNLAAGQAFYGGNPIASDPDGETVTEGVAANPSLLVVKSAVENKFSAIGDVLNYSYLVINTGNVTLTGPFTVNDDRSSDETCPVTAALDPGQYITCTATYTVTQTDLDADNVTNTATAQGSFGGTPVVSAPDSETVPEIGQTSGLVVIKSVTSSGPYVVGATITYNITAINTGTSTLTGVTVSDPGTGVTLGTCNPAIPATLTAGQNLTCQASHVVTEADITAGSYTNTAYADSDQTEPSSDTEVVNIGQAPAPAISVLKEVSIDGGTTWQDANSPTGPNLASGTDPRFRFMVTNTGNVALTGITLGRHRHQLVLPI